MAPNLISTRQKPAMWGWHRYEPRNGWPQWGEIGPTSCRRQRGTYAAVVTAMRMVLDFDGVMVAPLCATTSGASLTPLWPPIVRFVSVPPLHRWFLPSRNQVRGHGGFANFTQLR